MELLQIGVIIDSFSLDGTAKLISTSTNKQLRYKSGNKAFLCSPNMEEKMEVIIEKGKEAGRNDLVKLSCFNTPEEVIKYKHWLLCVEKNINDLNEGYYYYSDLEGCKVINQDGKEIGIVSKVEEFPAQVTLRCRTNDNKDFFVPFIKAFILKVDINNKEIKINQIEGML